MLIISLFSFCIAVSNKSLANLIEAADKQAMDTHFATGKVLDKSRKATQNATYSKEEALVLEEEVRNTLNKTQGNTFFICVKLVLSKLGIFVPF